MNPLFFFDLALHEESGYIICEAVSHVEIEKPEAIAITEDN
jgi:hypothetical protein